LADRLKALRLAAGYAKARHFARELGISENRYTRYERGEAEPDFDLMRTICAKLGTTPNELFGWRPAGTSVAPVAAASSAFAGPGFAEPPLAPLSDDKSPSDAATSSSTLVELAAWRLASAFGDAGVGLEPLPPGDAPLGSLRLTAELFLQLRQAPLATVARLLRGLDVARLTPERQAALSQEIEAFVALQAQSLDDRTTASTTPAQPPVTR
jgi:transcriptional regulator with XRE-family HTH domain